MKTLKTKTVAVIKNSHTKEEMEEIEREFLTMEKSPCTIQQLIEMSRNENLHKDRR
ncbi:hypothetical protein FHS68_004457 [Dyadobacter arcticus]|uniref:CopG family transcriptional regulator n=1 Tax=Dyadobacter arcticus TaxID=1078754 RepID=A0ABX0UQJ6_9BACT|nr:hypothetical protein [Dyadobacter arcticus]